KRRKTEVGRRKSRLALELTARCPFVCRRAGDPPSLTEDRFSTRSATTRPQIRVNGPGPPVRRPALRATTRRRIRGKGPGPPVRRSRLPSSDFRLLTRGGRERDRRYAVADLRLATSGYR